MKSLFALLLAALLFTACANDNPADAPAPPKNLTATHDTVAMDTPPVPTGTLDGEFGAKLLAISINKMLVVANSGAYYGADRKYIPYTLRVGDSSRVWFEADNCPFLPYRMRYNGTHMGDSIPGWFRVTDTRDNSSSVHPITFRRMP